ncbi:MAG: hypothetical protein IKY82_04760 [Alistipes sp.]|nr:hypothetical protein [Alistipes sp.]
MYEVSSEVYLEAAERLLSLLSLSDYYSGSFEFESNGLSCRMVLSAVIYGHYEQLPEGVQNRVIDNIIPVWWEFHTTDESGERLNDFDFSEFRKVLAEITR